MNKKLKCKVCGEKTPMVVNINFKATPVCQNCCDNITLQNVRWLVDNQMDHESFKSNEK